MILHPATDAWKDEWDTLMADPFLKRKLDRSRRVTDHLDYIAEYLPEIKDSPPGLVIDVGPGCGELLEMARECGHTILGIDAPNGIGGMGDGYLAACRLMHQRQHIPVEYVGFEAWLLAGNAWAEESVVAVNMRGSIEQCLSRFMVGPPHHEHHNCQQLDWSRTTDTVQMFDRMFSSYRSMLRDDGVVLIHANGTGYTNRWYDTELRASAERCGLKLVRQEKNRLHKFAKQGGTVY